MQTLKDYGQCGWVDFYHNDLHGLKKVLKVLNENLEKEEQKMEEMMKEKVIEIEIDGEIQAFTIIPQYDEVHLQPLKPTYHTPFLFRCCVTLARMKFFLYIHDLPSIEELIATDEYLREVFVYLLVKEREKKRAKGQVQQQ